MTTPQPYLTDGCLVLDNSGLSGIKNCPTFGKYKQLDKREKAGVTAKGRVPGQAIHSAMETRYKLCGGQRPSDDNQATIEAALAAHMTDAPATGDEHLTLDRLQKTMAMYRDGCRIELGKDGKNGIYSFDGYGQENFDVLWVEVPFAARIGEVAAAGAIVPVIWIGKSDLGVQMHERGERLVLDHKTMRKWDSSTITFWNMAAGPKGYATCIPLWVREGISELPPSVQAAMQPWEGERQRLAAAGVGDARINGFMLNAIVQRDAYDLVRAKQPPTAFHRHQVFYRPDALDEWRTDTLRWCKAWLDWCAAGAWPMNDAHCTSHYGMSCPYSGVCSLPAEQRQLVLSTDEFTNTTFNPLTKA